MSAILCIGMLYKQKNELEDKEKGNPRGWGRDSNQGDCSRRPQGGDVNREGTAIHLAFPVGTRIMKSIRAFSVAIEVLRA